MNNTNYQKIQGCKFDKDFNYEKLFDSYKSMGLQSSNLNKSIEILNEVIKEKKKMGDDFKIIFGFTSNIISSGLRDIVRYMCQNKMIDAICTTSGGLEEDFMKCFKDTFIGKFKNNDKQLRKDGINRIGNMLVPNENYCTFQNFFTPLHDNMYKKQKEENFSWTPSKIIDYLGSQINDETSVYYWCSKNKIPVFCTAITDGAIGDNVFFQSYQHEDFKIDITEDIWLLNDIGNQSKKNACLILGGGMVKYQIMSMGLFNNGFDYAVFINDGMEFDGSDSGQGTKKEIREGKIKKNAKCVKVNSEISLIFPIIVARTFAKKLDNQSTNLKMFISFFYFFLFKKSYRVSQQILIRYLIKYIIQINSNSSFLKQAIKLKIKPLQINIDQQTLKMNMQNMDHIFKILIIGDSSVGKSNILLRFSDNIFHETFLPTIGVDFKIKNIQMMDKSVKLNIWDTAGQERFKTITATYYKGSHGIILVYDITDRTTFNNIQFWLEEVKKHAGANVVKFLVGNKCDLESQRQVTTKEGQDFADSIGVSFLETSAKEKTNIDEVFMGISKQIYECLPESEKQQDNNYQQLSSKRKSDKGGCC